MKYIYIQDDIKIVTNQEFLNVNNQGYLKSFRIPQIYE